MLGKRVIFKEVKLVKILQLLEKSILFFSSYIPVKYEKLKEPTNSDPGLIRVHTIQEKEDGTKEEVTEEFNTVCFVFASVAE